MRRVLARGLAATESQPGPGPASPCETEPTADQQTPATSFRLLIDQGPFTESQVLAMLVAGEVTPETLFKWGAMTDWQPLQTIIIPPGAQPEPAPS